MLTIPLTREAFTSEPTVLLTSESMSVSTKRYPSGVESLTITNSRGHVEILPFLGGIIWDAVIDGHSLRMTNMFTEPKPVDQIVDTYGCFAFHSGLLSAGCPSPRDDHPLHGEFPCAPMDKAWLEASDDAIRVVSSYEYVQGFGHHYLAQPSVKLSKDAGTFDIDLEVTNLSGYAPMPLQYMCHMNYAFVPGGVMSQDAGTFELRRSVPDHVTPTERWTEINEDILAGKIDADSLESATEFDPEIVYFADDLPERDMTFRLTSPEGWNFITRFSGSQFPVATRWILHNPDQKVAAFVLPGTSRPEGRVAANEAGTLIKLEAGETRRYHVTTGVED